MKREVLMVLICVCIALNISADVSQINQYPSIVINASGADTSNFVLVNNKDQALIPVKDLSRQFIAPGSYTLTYTKWGMHRYENSFSLETNMEKEITFYPTPINPRILKKLKNSTNMNRISIVASVVTLGCAGAFKAMGDMEFDKYNKATDYNEIKKYRSSSNTYQTAFYTSSSVCLSSALTWFITKAMKKSAKKQVINEMGKQAP